MTEDRTNGSTLSGAASFQTGGDAYAAFRPSYPPELAAALAALAPSRGQAVDVGCGTGQLTALLADHFQQVIGVDPSRDQIAHAPQRANLRFVAGSADALPVEDGHTHLITAAQAAHWFDLPLFYDQARRIAAPGAALALVSYGVNRISGPVAERLDRFYARDLAPHWPPERRLVERGYVDLPFPFAPLTVEPMVMTRQVTLGGLLGYLGTWSAVKRARAAGQEALITAFAADATRLWGDPDTEQTLSWPLTVRAGRL